MFLTNGIFNRQIKVNLILETKSSGPKKGTMIDEDLAFMCSPPYYWLYDEYSEDIELLPYAPVFDDKRNNNEPLIDADLRRIREQRMQQIKLLA